jgi:hypothetical protein
MSEHRLVGDRFHDNDPRSNQMIRYREPALTAVTLLAPAVGLFLLLFATFDAETQAAWNAAAVAVAGFITAAIAAREKLAPAILGLTQAVLALLTVYGFGLTAEQATGVTAFVALVVGTYLRERIVAPVTVDGAVVAPTPSTYA